jgi:hypothetical protein
VRLEAREARAEMAGRIERQVLIGRNRAVLA